MRLNQDLTSGQTDPQAPNLSTNNSSCQLFWILEVWNMPENTLDPLLDLMSKEFQKKSFMLKKKSSVISQKLFCSHG